MTTLIIENKQSLIDVALQTAGTIDAVFELIVANGFVFDFTQNLTPGTELKIPIYVDKNIQVLDYFNNNNIKIATDNVIVEAIAPSWLLRSGFWDDNNVWNDDSVWIDEDPFFYNT